MYRKENSCDWVLETCYKIHLYLLLRILYIYIHKYIQQIVFFKNIDVYKKYLFIYFLYHSLYLRLPAGGH